MMQNQMSKKSINETKIIIYTTKTCGYCYLAKNLLKKYSLKYKEIDVSNNNIIKNESSSNTTKDWHGRYGNLFALYSRYFKKI